MNTRDAITALDTLSTPTQSALIDARQRGEEAGRLYLATNQEQPNPYKYTTEHSLYISWLRGYEIGATVYLESTKSGLPIMDDEDAYKASLQALKQKCLMADRRRVEDSLRKNSLLSLCFSVLSLIPRERFGPDMRATLDSVQDQVEMELARKEGGV